MTPPTQHRSHLIKILPCPLALISMIVPIQLGTLTKLDASSEEETKTVAALDTKYQAAVKANDAATMDQILADDFVLVIGGGVPFLAKLTCLTRLEKRKSLTNVRTKNLERRRSGYGVTQPW